MKIAQLLQYLLNGRKVIKMEENRNISSLRADKHDVITGKVKIAELHDFKGHPFKVEHDMELFKLSKSIEENGVLVPLIARKNPNGCGYEIISGHKRKAACEWAGITEIPIVVMELNDAEAVITMVDSNLQKEWLSVFAPGHQAVIAAHPDGRHGSKNMHVHIVFNSVRKYAGVQEKWHYKPCEWKQGCKHRSTGRMMHHAKKWVMRRCLIQGYEQVDLLTKKHRDDY